VGTDIHIHISSFAEFLHNTCTFYLKVKDLFIVQVSKLRILHGLHQNYTFPGIGTHSFMVSSPWREYNALSAVEAIHTVFDCSFYQVPINRLQGFMWFLSPVACVVMMRPVM
jgi:hypothetical protein